MSPVLLDHRNLKWIWLSVGLLVAMTFFGGYILGFEKSNNKWLAKLDPVEITLPNALFSDLIAVEPQIPEIVEPGASIDVDNVDAPVIEKVVAIAAKVESPIIESTSIEEKPLKSKFENNTVQLDDEQKKTALESYADVSSTPINTTSETVPVAFTTTTETGLVSSYGVPGIGGPAQHEQNVESSSDLLIETVDIVDDATEETARYSIQVGMYKSFDNAAAKVEQLINSDLSGYLQDYKNKNDEMRYNVRFGYFNAFSNAEQALAIYQKSYSGSGYIARFKR